MRLWSVVAQFSGNRATSGCKSGAIMARFLGMDVGANGAARLLATIAFVSVVSACCGGLAVGGLVMPLDICDLLALVEYVLDAS